MAVKKSRKRTGFFIYSYLRQWICRGQKGCKVCGKRYYLSIEGIRKGYLSPLTFSAQLSLTLAVTPEASTVLGFVVSPDESLAGLSTNRVRRSSFSLFRLIIVVSVPDFLPAGRKTSPSSSSIVNITSSVAATGVLQDSWDELTFSVAKKTVRVASSETEADKWKLEDSLGVAGSLGRDDSRCGWFSAVGKEDSGSVVSGIEGSDGETSVTTSGSTVVKAKWS